MRHQLGALAESKAPAQRWHQTRAVRQGIMQQLLTGRVRLTSDSENE